MKAKIVALGVTDDRQHGTVEVRLPVDAGGARLTFVVPVNLVMEIAKTDLLGPDVSMEVTLTHGNTKVTIK